MNGTDEWVQNFTSSARSNTATNTQQIADVTVSRSLGCLRHEFEIIGLSRRKAINLSHTMPLGNGEFLFI